MLVIVLYARVFFGNAVDNLLPHRTSVNQHIVLVNQGDLLAVAGRSKFERVAHGALNTECGVDRNFVCNLVRGANADCSTVTYVRTLGAFANHDEVDLARVCQWADNTRVKLGWAQVDVVVESKAELEKKPTLKHTAWNAWVADGAEQDGVVFLKAREVGIGEGITGCVVTAGAQVVFVGCKGNARTTGHGF